jgi:preprotein translocase subunit SecG
MTTILLVIHLFLAIGLVISVLLQRSEGGALGIGGGGGLMTSRGSANFLTRTTAVLAGLFMAMSLLLAIISSGERKPRSILDEGMTTPTQQAPAKPAPAGPPEAPGVPLAR